MAECDLTSPFPSTPQPPSSPPLPALRPFSVPITPQRNPGDDCFSCRRKGHWAKECPNKTQKKSQSSSPGSTSMGSSGLPLIRCPCGRGTCPVFTSGTQKNPERKFYTCPGDKSSVKCNFFKWCDELANKAPMCPCGVGICSLNLSRGSTGPNGEEWYFACRIKKNHGACNFFQWVDSEVNTMMKRYVGAAINDLDNKEVSSNIVSESPVVEGDENTPNQPIFVISSEQDEVPNRDLIMQEVESEVRHQVFHPIHQTEIHCLKELSRQISVAGSIITQALLFRNFEVKFLSSFCCLVDVVYQVLGFHGYGWLDRLAFPPSRCMKGLPVLPIFCLRDAQLLGGALQEASGLNEPSGITQDESKSILKEYGLALLNTIESMSPVRHGAMAKLAEATLKMLKDLSIECGPIGEGVKTYIHSISRVASIERSIYKGLTPQELLKLLNSEQVQFENISRRHAEAVAAYTASNNHFQSLRKEVSSVKDMLLHLEKRLFSCEAETLALKTRVDEISKDMLESERSMEAASEKMEEALELERQRDTVIGEAKAALETARFWLEQ
ncbi:uncharacterized protein LOC110640365 isoform X3 [Hevea brasiliensis]|uniref:uncharacterized protein LOC110640365 isoform X3 n=1 Tax=Hevea brasiliensis TaxID=3981 RepID=UPI0025D9D155|nr:uncharacterized protein LOC110640365 isoform X3 [Hevea brasiliensis]